MAKIFINALASTAGGGVTYLRNVLPRLSAWRHLHDFFVFLPASYDVAWIDKFRSFLTVMPAPVLSGIGARVWWEQRSLRKIIQRQHGDLLISLGNFALLKSPVPQTPCPCRWRAGCSPYEPPSACRPVGRSPSASSASW